MLNSAVNHIVVTTKDVNDKRCDGSSYSHRCSGGARAYLIRMEGNMNPLTNEGCAHDSAESNSSQAVTQEAGAEDKEALPCPKQDSGMKTIREAVFIPEPKSEESFYTDISEICARAGFFTSRSFSYDAIEKAENIEVLPSWRTALAPRDGDPFPEAHNLAVEILRDIVADSLRKGLVGNLYADLKHRLDRYDLMKLRGETWCDSMYGDVNHLENDWRRVMRQLRLDYCGLDADAAALAERHQASIDEVAKALTVLAARDIAYPRFHLLQRWPSGATYLTLVPPTFAAITIPDALDADFLGRLERRQRHCEHQERYKLNDMLEHLQHSLREHGEGKVLQPFSDNKFWWEEQDFTRALICEPSLWHQYMEQQHTDCDPFDDVFSD